MFYVPEILSMRKKGKLSRCWLAGILSERMFKSKVTNRKIMSVDIQESCDEILRVLNRNSNDYRERFSLALSARLMCGVVKLHYYQVTLFEKSLSMALISMQPDSLETGKKNEKKTTIDLNLDMTNAFTIPEPPEFNFDDLTFGPDVNLMQEVSPRSLRRNREMAESAQPDFGPITDDEVIQFMGTDDWDFGEPRQDDSEHQEQPPPTTVEVLVHAASLSSILADIQDTVQKTAKKPAPPPTIEISEVSEGHAASLSSFIVDAQPQVHRTSKKRPSTTFDEETSSKRRKTFDPEIERAPDNQIDEFSSIHPSLREEDRSIPFAPAQQEDESLPPLIAALPNGVEDHTTTLPSALEPIREEDEAIPLEAIPPEPTIQQVPHLPVVAARQVPPLPEKKRKDKRGSKRIDKYKNVQVKVIKKLTSDVQAHTQPPRMAVPAQKREIPISAMFKYASSSFEFGTAEFLCVRQKRFSIELLEQFRAATAKIVVETSDVSTNRLLDYLEKNGTIEQSVSARRDKSGPTTSSHDDSEPPAVQNEILRPLVDDAHAGPLHAPQFESISEVPLPLAEVTDEHTFEDTSKAQPVIDETEPTVRFENGEQVEISNELEAEALNPVAPSSDLLQGRDEEKIMSVESPETPRFEILDGGWSKPDLEACLEVEWHDCPLVPFKKLNPPGETRKHVAASCFSLLLELRAARKVVLSQTDQIYIKKAVPWTNGTG